MPRSLRNSARVETLAHDLGLKRASDPLAAILGHCELRVRRYLKEFPCHSLSELLDLTAAKVGTQFRRVETDDELTSLCEEYIARGETAFATLQAELTPTVFGITLRLQKAEPWERRFVSVIDCRGEKAWRSYFTKWHEVAHLLTLTPQARLAFKRTHGSDSRDPEEAVMDVIAGTLGFYAPIARAHVRGEISFDAIEALRQELCPEASRQAALLGLIDSWSTPSLLVTAMPALKSDEEIYRSSQQRFVFYQPPAEKLRAVRVKANQAARETGFSIFENMRVPENSVISQVHSGALYAEQAEDLSWWQSSGRSLPPCPVRVIARRVTGSVEAIITAIQSATSPTKARRRVKPLPPSQAG